jgi:rSAM/selenodomain-associated transferase 2
VKISAIIPVINEATRLATAIERAWESGVDEVLVVDGGSTDGSLEIARQARCFFVTSDIGRGQQQNAGASRASGDVLLFLHADNWLAPNACQQIRDRFAAGQLFFGGFLQHIEAPNRIFRWIERGNVQRVKWRGLVYGDQAMFISRELFDAVGGFPAEPIMEDLILSGKLKQHCRPELMPGPVFVDARRWQKTGPLRQSIRNWWLVTLFYCGVTPTRLLRMYRQHDRI